MDRTLLLLLIVSGLLLALLAPHATFTLTVVITLSTLATRAIWAMFSSFEESGPTRNAWD